MIMSLKQSKLEVKPITTSQSIGLPARPRVSQLHVLVTSQELNQPASQVSQKISQPVTPSISQTVR